MNESDQINDILGVSRQDESTIIVKSGTTLPDEKQSNNNGTIETILTVIAYIILVFGIISSIAIGAEIGSDEWGSTSMGFIYFICGTISSTLIWGVLMVLVNISNNLREIKRSLKSR